MHFDQLMATGHFVEDAWVLDVPSDWLQGRTVFGGLQSAMVLKAMRRLVPTEVKLRSLQVNFIGPVPAGQVRASASVLRQGKSATQAQGEIVVNGEVAMRALAIFGASRSSAVERAPAAPACAKKAAELNSLPFLKGITPDFTQHVEMRWAKGQPPFTGASDPSAQIYVRLREAGRLSEAHLVAACDIIPPPILATLKQPTAASSMNWQLEIVGDPDPLGGEQWLRVDAELIASHAGYCWQSAKIWSEGGKLLALGHQCVAVFG